jgi:hypothetical protein
MDGKFKIVELVRLGKLGFSCLALVLMIVPRGLAPVCRSLRGKEWVEAPDRVSQPCAAPHVFTTSRSAIQLAIMGVL